MALSAVGWRAEQGARAALEEALEARLVSVAGAATVNVSPRVLALGPGDDDTRTKKNALKKLHALATAAGAARLLIVDREHRVLVDTEERLPVGAPYRRARLDAPALLGVLEGQSKASPLYAGPAGEAYKTAYAPLRTAGQVAGYAAAVAPASYPEALAALRQQGLLLGILGLLAVAGAALLIAGVIARPLTRLSGAAEAIGAGALTTEVPGGGPAETEILADTMRDMAASLRAREEELQMMLAGIAHEVRNPLGGIELFGGLLREDLEGDPRRKHVDKILRELGVLAQVVNDFLDYARQEPHETVSTDVGELLYEVAGLAEADAEKAKVTLTVSNAVENSVRLHRPSVQRALLNLVRNAIQAAESAVSIAATFEAHRLRLSVDDDGSGVPANKEEEIFKPFFTTKQKGSGLGLALVRKTALAHGGETRVETSSMGGARFTVDVPTRE